MDEERGKKEWEGKDVGKQAGKVGLGGKEKRGGESGMTGLPLYYFTQMQPLAVTAY